MKFEKLRLGNGLTILGEINGAARSAAVGFFVRTGARDENLQISGVSHFLEHMVFKGTQRLSSCDVNEAFDRIGAKFNAFTSEENTVYYSAVLPEYLYEATGLWTELMRPSLRAEDFETEKKVILEEIAMYRDIPQFDVLDKARALHFGRHPCANSVLGSEQTVLDMTAGQMREYFGRRYSADNIVAACCGDIDFEKICSLIEERCGGWSGAGAGRAGRELSFTQGSRARQDFGEPKLATEHICLVSPAVSAQDGRRFAASLFAVIAGDQTGSRFFWALVDNAIAETVTIEYQPMDGVGAFYTYIRCGPENASKAMRAADEVFAVLAKDGVTEGELQKAKNKVLSALTIKNEIPMGRLVNLGFDWVYLKGYRSIEDDIADVKAVSVEDVNAIITDFRPGDYTKVRIGPGG